MLGMRQNEKHGVFCCLSKGPFIGWELKKIACPMNFICMRQCRVRPKGLHQSVYLLRHKMHCHVPYFFMFSSLKDTFKVLA